MKVGARIYEHGDGRWEARYRKGRRDDGSIIYGSVYGKTYDEAEKKRAEILRSIAEHAEDSPELAALSEDNRSLRIYYQTSVKETSKYPAPLDKYELDELLSYIIKCREGIKLALCSALYMGLSNEEISALRYSDFDMSCDKLTIGRVMTDAKHAAGMIVPCEKRTVDIPGIIRDYVDLDAVALHGADNYLLTDRETPVASLRQAKRMCSGAPAIQGYEKNLRPEVLRATFICRCLEGGMNFETVSYLTGLGCSVLKSRYGHYVQPNPSLLRKINVSNNLRHDTEPGTPKPMNLLILGAGSHGHAVYEIADKLGIFQKIRFLDDNVSGEAVIGKCSDNLLKYRDEYVAAFVAIGDNAVRRHLGEEIIKAGFVVPKIISPDASIAKGVTIGAGSVVMPQATINAGARIGSFSIIESNSLVGYRAEIRDCVHLGVAAVAMKETVVSDGEDIESGEIVRN